MDPEEEYYVIPSDNTRVAGGKPQLIPHKTAKHVDVGRGISDYLPFIGDALLLGDAYEDYSKGNYGSALANVALLAVPNVIEKPAKALIKTVKTVKKASPMKRTLIPVKAEGDVPIYTRELVENGLDTSLQLGKSGKGISFNANDGSADITSGNMNVQGVAIDGGKVGAARFMFDRFNEAPHGQIISFSKHFKDIDQPLSTDSYPLMLNYLSQLEKEGKGMFISNPYPEKFILNSAGEKNGVEFYPLLLKRIDRINKKFGKSFNAPELKYKGRKNPFKKGTPMYDNYEAHPEKLNAAHFYEGEPITFIKFKKGGNL